MRKASLLVAGFLLAPTPLEASCHLMEIVEVFAGTDADPNAHYVVLRMTAAGQEFVVGNTITTSSGTFASFAGNVANGSTGATILIATSEAASLLGLAADQTASGTLDFPNGMVAHDCSLDSVTYGTGPIPALVRGCALKKSGGAWSLGDPAPTNNAGISASLDTCVAPDGGFPEPAVAADMGVTDGHAHEHDANGGGEGEEDDGGCGCRIGGRSQGTLGWAVLLALAAIALRRRS